MVIEVPTVDGVVGAVQALPEVQGVTVSVYAAAPNPVSKLPRLLLWEPELLASRTHTT